MVKWVARFAIIAALLGIAGTAAIIIYLQNHQNKEKLQDDLKQEAATNSEDTLTSHPKPLQKSKPKTHSAEVPMAATEREAVIKKVNPANKPTIRLKEGEEKSVQSDLITGKEKQPHKTEPGSKPAAQKSVDKDQDEKLFSQEELQQIVVRINTAKEENSIYSNCVQIFSARKKNNTRSLSQLENYLRGQRFSIAGRETTPKKVTGIKITPSGGCIRITLGSL